MKLLLAFLFLPYLLHSQSMRIEGIVTDVESNVSLPFAHVGLANSTIGVITNSKGEFSLILPTEKQSKQLQVSYLGYTSRLIQIQQIPLNEQLIVKLTAVHTNLPELIIQAKKRSIIEEAIDAIPRNHDQSNMRLRGFWRSQMKDTKDFIQLSETAFDVFRSDGKDVLQILKGRASRDTTAFEQFKAFNAGISPKSLFNSSFLIDLSILSKKIRKKHTYEIKDVSTYNNRPVFVVDFDKKKSNRDTGYKGRILLDTETLAFVKISFGFSPWNTEVIEIFDSWISKKITKLGNSTWDKFDSEFNYHYADGKWYLSHSNFNVDWTLRDNDNTFSALIHYYGDFVVTEISKKNIILPEKDERARKGILIGQLDGSTEDFWKNFNYLIPDQDYDQVFKEMDARNKKIRKKK